METYDVIIIGAGPAGIFTALEISDNSGLKTLLLEKGPDLRDRVSELERYNTRKGQWTSPYNCGWGGAGAFSDGKLTLSGEVGGFLPKYIGDTATAQLISDADGYYVSYGAPTETYGDNAAKIRALQDLAMRHDLRLLSTRIRHMGSDRCTSVLQNLWDHLRQRIEIRMRTPVARILVKKGVVWGVETETGEKIPGRYVIVAPGREGAGWFRDISRDLKLSQLRNPVDIGLRIEVPSTVMQKVTDICFEAKFIYYSPTFDDKVRTFCMCPYGEVIMESYDGIFSVNGHSYHGRKTENTNFAVLVSTDFTEPFQESIQYGISIARLANLLSNGVIVQRLGDLMSGRRSTPNRIRRGLVKPTFGGAVPGDLSFVLPYRYLQNIFEMLEALNHVVPGIHSRHTLVYGVEVKFYSQGVKLTKHLETGVDNLFAIGDGAGVSRGLIQASASGLVVAREILHREK